MKSGFFRSLWIGLCASYILLLLGAAVFAPWIAPYSYETQNREAILAAPSPKHWLGTDELGRDVFSRLLYGARVSLGIGLGVESITIFVALLIGTLAGYFRGKVDTLLMRFTDAMFAFPDILLAILILGISGPGFQGVLIALAVVNWPSMTRLVRGLTLVLREKDFVLAAQSTGAPGSWIARKHLFPHLIRTVFAVSTVEIAGLILAESALSFIGIGVQPPYPSWGSMISNGRDFMRSQPSLVFYPALALSMTVISLTFVGEWLQDRWQLIDRKSF